MPRGWGDAVNELHGDAYDNAESFVATLRREVPNRRQFRSQAEVRMAIVQWVEG